MMAEIGIRFHDVLRCLLCDLCGSGRCVVRWDELKGKFWVPGPKCPGPGVYELARKEET
jgi:hypothetical protein